jgi:Cu-Zn family superoxide dismutase
LANSRGKVNYTYYDDLVELFGEHSVVGRSVVVNAWPDDLGYYRDDPTALGLESRRTGNSGPPIAYAIVGLSPGP